MSFFPLQRGRGLGKGWNPGEELSAGGGWGVWGQLHLSPRPSNAGPREWPLPVTPPPQFSSIVITLRYLRPVQAPGSHSSPGPC